LSCAYKSFNSLFEPVSIEHIPVVTSQNITTLPAGTEIFITLNTNVQLGSSIVSIDFGIFINGETLNATIPANIIGTSAIAALQFNVVGGFGLGDVTSGSGETQFLSSDPLTAVNFQPDFIANFTFEGSNCQYGQMASGSSNVVTQTFNAPIS
jgi:hypothetical protein